MLPQQASYPPLKFPCALVVQCLLTHVKVKCRNETRLGNLKSS